MNRITKVLFTRQGGVWLQQSLLAREELAKRAREHQIQKTAELRAEYDALAEERALLVQQMNEEAGETDEAPLLMSSATLEECYLDLWDRLYQSSEFKASMVHARVNVGVSPPPVEPPAGEEPVWVRPKPVLPDWHLNLARDRESFQECALVCSLADGQVKYFKILYCVQGAELYTAFCPLEPTAHMPVEVTTGMSSLDVHMQGRAHSFRCKFADHLTGEDLPDVPFEKWEVLRGLWHEGGTLVTTIFEPEPLHVVMRGLQIATRQEANPDKKRQKMEHAQELEGIIAEMPWLQYLDKMEVFKQHLREAATTDSQIEAVVDEDLAVVDEDALLACLDDLDAMRAAEAKVARDIGTHDFTTRYRAGMKAFEATGEYSDAVQGVADSKGAVAWCKKRFLQQTFKCTFPSMTRSQPRP